MLEGILIIFLLIGIALISRSVTTLVHELGHAIPSLLFTKEQVIVCVGSYGDVSNSLSFSIGRLRIFLKFNFLSWNLGLCSHQGIAGFWKTLIVIIGGPIASLILALTLFYFMVFNNYSDTVIVVLTFFILSSLWDFAVNIYPVSTPFYLFNGSEIHNDGYRFLSLIKRRNYPDSYYTAMESSLNFEYEKSVAVLKNLLKEGFDNREVNDLIIANLMKNGDYDEALKHFGSFKLTKKLKSRDYYTLGAIYFELKKYNDAIKCLNKAIHGDFQNVQYLNKRGLCYAETGAHENAFKDFNAAIYYNPNYLLSFLNRGNLKIRLDDLEGGYADIQRVIEFDGKIPLAYIYLGYYYKKKHDYALAMESFEKAKALNSDYQSLDFLIEEMSGLVKKKIKI